MSEYAAAIVHVPETGETFFTPFDGDNAATQAFLFKCAEQERGDFPTGLWAVVMNEPARERREQHLRELVGLSDPPKT